MNPAYTLALKLGIPIIIQPEWSECKRLLVEGQKLRKKGRKFREKGVELREEGWKLYQEAITRELGLRYLVRINWETGEVR